MKSVKHIICCFVAILFVTPSFAQTVQTPEGFPAKDGHETNWVQTIPNEYWFTYFRLYAPTEAYFDRSWPMYDIERID